MKFFILIDVDIVSTLSTSWIATTQNHNVHSTTNEHSRNSKQQHKGIISSKLDGRRKNGD